jgi:hypothetical protein
MARRRASLYLSWVGAVVGAIACCHVPWLRGERWVVDGPRERERENDRKRPQQPLRRPNTLTGVRGIKILMPLKPGTQNTTQSIQVEA